ncbi:MAG: CoA-binding protein [Phycisphaerae bacterium]|nr:CoA-binding protein [Phycisphaerae bacterium]
MSRKTVAVLGASADRSKFSNKAVRAYIEQGWEVYPVNPKGGEIEGLTAYARLTEIPVKLDRITVYLPPKVTLAALDDIARVQAGEVFINPGAENDEVIDKARELGVEPILACSIVDIGVTPGRYPG